MSSITEVPIPIRRMKEPEMPPAPKPEVIKKAFHGLAEIARLDISPLFYEPEPAGVFSKFVPYINLAVMFIVLLVLMFKK